MKTRCSICNEKLDSPFPLIAEHPQNRICSTCSILKGKIVDAANRNDAIALEESANIFLAQICPSTSAEVRADMAVIISRNRSALTPTQEDSEIKASTITTASDHISGHQITRYCGPVAVNASVLIKALMPGCESSAQVAATNNHVQMLNQARARGANALINYRVIYTTLNSEYLLISSKADSVFVEPEA